MREIKKKWILANIVNETLKAVVVLAPNTSLDTS